MWGRHIVLESSQLFHKRRSLGFYRVHTCCTTGIKVTASLSMQSSNPYVTVSSGLIPHVKRKWNLFTCIPWERKKIWENWKKNCTSIVVENVYVYIQYIILMCLWSFNMIWTSPQRRQKYNVTYIYMVRPKLNLHNPILLTQTRIKHIYAISLHITRCLIDKLIAYGWPKRNLMAFWETLNFNNFTSSISRWTPPLPSVA